MLKHQSQNILAGERVGYSVPYQEVYCKSTEQLDEDTLACKNLSSGCDDSGVFLEDPIASSPETQSRSAVSRLQNSLDKFSSDSTKMRQYSIQEGLDSDAEKSDDLGLASSSIDSADDLDGDPLPSTLQIASNPPIMSSRQKPPPVPARKSVSRSDYQKNNKYHEIVTIEVPNQHKPPLSKSSSSGDDSNFGEGDHFLLENSSFTLSFNEKSKNIINQQKNEQSRSNFAMTRSFHEDMLLNQQRDINHDSKSNFLARTLSSSASVKKLDMPNGSASPYSRRSSEQPAGLKWKSEECLRTAAENKWSLPGRRHEKSVSVKDRIAMFSEMEANQNSGKREDLQRYGSENNIKAMTTIVESKKPELSLVESNKSPNLLKDSKWHSMQSITKKPVEKETTYMSTNMKPAISIPSLTSNNLIDNMSSNNYATLPVKLDVEPPKPIVSSYPETQLTNNKRYNYGLYSLKNLKNTENLLSKKAAGANLLSIIDSRKQPTQKLKGLVIPDKPYQANSSKELPTIVSSDSDGLMESRRASLPITAVTATKAMSLPRNKRLECVPAQRQTSLTEPPWKSDTSSTYTLPKYSPAFKKRSLELPGSSLSPTPPSSITSPMSPPPSSPSSICSSNASSSLQQNVFQFSLSHSKPVQPLQPEKALMSPPSMPSDVEYEGDNSEDSSHSASPMRGSVRSSKEIKTVIQDQNSNGMNYSLSNSCTSSAKSIPHQPMMVEPLLKSPPPPESEPPKPKAAVYLSKTEILLKKDEIKSDSLARDQDFMPKSEISELMTNTFMGNDRILEDISSCKTNGSVKDDNYCQMKVDVPDIPLYEDKNGDLQYDNQYFSIKVTAKNGTLLTETYMSPEAIHQELSLGKFRALPVSLKESDSKSTIINPPNSERRHKRNHDHPSWGNSRPPHSECEESEDEDSHSTLSHRTEDSRHTTTDDCLSDATTDSFEKPRLVPDSSSMQRPIDDNASTEGYLSDASTDVSIRRFTNRPIDSNAYSTEEYLSDVTAESPDPEWISHRGSMDHSIYSRSKSYGRHESIQSREEDGSENGGKNMDFDLRPRRLSQQRTVLKASAEPSGSVQKFKALAEKWEQRADVTSPPPPTVVQPPLSKRESKVNAIASGIISSSCVTSTVIKGKSSLPPSLMPRNSSEKKAAQSSKSSNDGVFAVRTTVEKESLASVDGTVTRQSISSTSTVVETTNGWNPQQYDEINRVEASARRDSSSSGSSSSKTTLKDDEVFDSPPPVQPETNGFEATVLPPTVPHVEDTVVSQNSQRQSQVSLSSRQDDIFNNEPRNRRGVDFSRTNPIPDWPKSNRPAFGAKSTFSVSDIRRSFENGSKEADKPALPPKKPPIPAARLNAPAVIQPPPVPVKKVPISSEVSVDSDDELKMVAELARNQLNSEGVGNKFDVLTVILRREGEGGGSVGITLAGGADYEVKEITVHKVISGSIADRDGRVLKGDRVMSINGRDLRGVSHGEALHILKAPSPKVLLVLARDKSGSLLQQNGTMERETKRKHDFVNNKDSETILVEILKDVAGLGFSIEGGRDSPQGDRPLLIKRIFKGGAADKDGQLEEGDEIIAVNDQPVSNMTRTEAWNFLKKLPEGPVLLKARKANIVS